MVVSKEWVAEHQKVVAVAKDTISNFEIPIEARQLAEKSLDEAKKAFDDFVVASQKVTSSFEAQVAAAQGGFEGGA